MSSDHEAEIRASAAAHGIAVVNVTDARRP
jgi:hypothetical protein